MEQLFNDPTRTRRTGTETFQKKSVTAMTPGEIVDHLRDLQNVEPDELQARKEIVLSLIFAAMALGLPALVFLHEVFQG